MGRRSLASDRRGAIAVLAAAGMTALIGMSAFAIDLGAAYSQKAKLQKVADSAALAGEIVWVKTGSASVVLTTVQDVVVANGYPTSIMQSTTSPTSAAPNVTVSLKDPSALTLGRVLGTATSVMTTAYSVASLVPTTVTACMVSLSTIQMNGKITTSNCAVAANSAQASSININGGGGITATDIDTPGTIRNGGTVTGVQNTGSASDAAADPYSYTQSLESNAVSACTSYQNYSNQTQPGCYTNANISSAITLNAGTYVFSNLNINSGGSISGTDVTLIFTSGNESLGGNGVSITAPTTGSWAGIAIYAAGGLTFNQNANYAINGAIYVPNGTFIVDGGAFNQSDCTYIVADSIDYNSTGSLNIPQTSCSSAYTSPKALGGTKVALIQ